MYPAQISSTTSTFRFFPWFAVGVCLVFLAFQGALIFYKGFSYGLAGAFLVVLLILAVVSQWTSCSVDPMKRQVTIQHRSLWRNRERTLHFDDLHTIAVQQTDSDDGANYRLVFVLQSGESVPLEKNGSTGKRGKQNLARKLAAMINRGRTVPVHEAPDGIVRIEREGTTRGIAWTLSFITRNEQVPLTKWQTGASCLSTGFLLIVPAVGSKKMGMPGGWLGSVVRLLYGRYLQMLDLAESDLPGFEGAELLSGSSLGLDDGLVVLTNCSPDAQAWLTPRRARLLGNWMRNHTLKGKPAAASCPHIVVFNRGLWLLFRSHFASGEPTSAIIELGSSLVEN
jgi:hypothetical protein